MPPTGPLRGRYSFAAQLPPPSIFVPYRAPRCTPSRSMNDAVIRASDPPRARPRTASGAELFQGLTATGLSMATAYAEFQLGVLEGLGESLKSAWSLVSHDLWQRRTWTELALTTTALGLIQPFNIAGGLADAQAFDRRWGTQVAQRQLEILAAIAKLAKDIPRWTPRQWGRAVGRLVGDVLLAKGAGAAVKVAVRVSVTATEVVSANVTGWELGIMTSRQAVKTVAQKLPTILTDAEGYLIGPVRFNAPFNLRVQRFGLMSLRKLDYWGPRTFGSSQTAARRFNAILPSWNELTLYTDGVIAKGTNLKFGITGSQGWRYPGGLYQVEVESRSVLQQSSKVLPKGK